MFRKYNLFIKIPTWFLKVGSFDMLIFNLLAGRGDLKYVSGIRSCYRRHSEGITSRDHNMRDRLNIHRIFLWIKSADYIDRFSEKDIHSVSIMHFDQILRLSGRRGGISAIRDLFFFAPISLLKRPHLVKKFFFATFRYTP